MRIITLVLIVLFCADSYSQDVSGMWYGILDFGSLKLRTNFHLIQDGENWKVSLYSPDQLAEAIDGGVVEVKADSVIIAHEQLNMLYKGVSNTEGTEINGVFEQAGQKLELNLSRNEIEKPKINRPQTPKGPFDYTVKEIEILNHETKLKLSATLNLPKGGEPYKIVVFASGSGPQDRDETIMEHKPFAVLAHHLAKNGIGSIRFDDRGTGKSEGRYSTTGIDGFASDVKAVYNYVNSKYKSSKIGLLGHSEGGMHIMKSNLATMDADFMIFMACVGIQGDKLYLKQQADLTLASGGSQEDADEAVKFWGDIIKIGKKEKEPSEALQKYMSNYYNELSDEEQKTIGGNELQFTAGIMQACNNVWFRSFMEFEPKDYWKSMKNIPVLALNGSKDIQVDPKMNLDGFEEGMKKVKNLDFTKYEIQGVNHLFQKCETGMISEYGAIETTIEEEVLELISGWIKNL